MKYWVVIGALGALAACGGDQSGMNSLTNTAAGTVALGSAGSVAGASAPSPAPAAGAVASPAVPLAGSPAAAAGSAAPAGGATFTAVLAIFVDQRCSLCHAMQTIGGGLVYDTADKQGTYQALVGATSKGASGSQCGGRTYVVAGQPDASLLYDKLSKPTPSCGVRMPATGTTLSDAELATVRGWIASGAKND
jgi:mono/diheme cytochrome c family protein